MKRLQSIALLSTSVLSSFAQLTFSGSSHKAILEKADANSGLNGIYVIYDNTGVKAEYTAASSSATVNWYRFSSLGGGYAEEIAFSKNGAKSSVSLSSDDMGYIIEEGSKRSYYWIVNYANHRCELERLTLNPETDCSSALLDFSGSAEKITYYSINGVGKTLSRGLRLEFTNLQFDEDSFSYTPFKDEIILESVGSMIHVPAPFCDTEFNLYGDKFLETWGEAESVVSPELTAVAVAATTKAVQTERDNDNEKEEPGASELGGSAPIEITFSAAFTDAAIYKEWQFSNDPEFADIDLRINETELTHTFLDFGTTYVRFIAGNDAGTCDFTSDTYSVFIGESRLECPNAFSPGTSEGTNDEWKVSYKSLISFDCHIFNRWGIEMCHLTDPSQGWDGKYNGKFVPSGVYYYVINAEGADGKRYKKSGDINIIKMKEGNGRIPSDSVE